MTEDRLTEDVSPVAELPRQDAYWIPYAALEVLGLAIVTSARKACDERGERVVTPSNADLLEVTLKTLEAFLGAPVHQLTRRGIHQAAPRPWNQPLIKG